MTAKPAAAVLALACAVLALAAFVTTTSEGALWSWGSDSSQAESGDGETCEGGDCGDEVVERDLDRTPTIEVPPWLDTLSNILLWVMSAALIMIILRRLRITRRARLLKGRVEAVGPQPFQEPPPTEAELLADELEEQLAVLAGGSPRNAIVAAWIALETTAERAGIERLDTETPTEFTRRALAHYRLDHDALQRLADLYREARFSHHRLTEHHLTQARDCLTVITEELRHGASRAGRPS